MARRGERPSRGAHTKPLLSRSVGQCTQQTDTGYPPGVDSTKSGLMLIEGLVAGPAGAGSQFWCLDPGLRDAMSRRRVAQDLPGGFFEASEVDTQSAAGIERATSAAQTCRKAVE